MTVSIIVSILIVLINIFHMLIFNCLFVRPT